MTVEHGIAGARAWLHALLVREGAILEPQAGGGVFACLPEPLQRALALPDAATLRVMDAPLSGELEVPLEGAALQAGLDLASRRGGRAAMRLDAPPCPAERARLLAGGVLQVDNAALHPVEVRVQPTRWLVLELAWTATADERASGSVLVAHQAALQLSSLAVAASLLARLDTAEPSSALPAPAEVSAAARAAWPVGRREIEAAVAPFVGSAAARLRREQTRLSAYHDKLLAEARRRRHRAGNAEAAAAKLAAIARDREEKQHEITQRFAVRCEVTVPSALAVEHDGTVVAFAVRRRTRERIVPIAIDALERVAIPPGCEACGAPNRVFHTCDDAVHLVCMGCKAKRCPACAGGPPQLPNR